MLLNLLFIFVLISFFITFTLFEFDFFHPAVIINLAYIVSIGSAVYNRDLWMIDMHPKTIALLILGVIIFIIVSFLSTSLSNSILSLKKQEELKEIKPQNLIFSSIMLINVVVLVLYIIEIRRVVGGNGILTSNVTDLISSYRNISYYSNENDARISGLINQISKIIPATTFSCLFIFINNYSVTKKIKTNRKYLLPIIVYSIQAIISGGRMPLIRLAIAILVMYYVFLLYNRPNNNLNSSFVILRRALLTFILLILSFYSLKFVLGRNSQENFIIYITRYMGGSIQLFDLFVRNPIRSNSEFGAETFSGIYEMLSKIGFENNIIKGLEWRVSPNGYSLGNVYTAIRRYYSDFGGVGIVLCQGFVALLYSNIYVRVRKDSLVNTTQQFRLILLAASFYPLFLNGIEDVFYISMVTIGYFIQIIIFYIIYRILVSVKVDILSGKILIVKD